MKSKENKNQNETFIHIKAESDIYSVSEIVAESKCLKRLIQIKKHFLWLNQRSVKFNSFLSVKTCVHNPRFDFNP